jgi:uncharacterized protein YdhG (YjbR/CyaY superfamily)
MKLIKPVSVEEFLNSQPDDRKQALVALREIIMEAAPKLTEEVEGNSNEPTMIVFFAEGVYIYAISSQKSRMSIHSMPMYQFTSIKEKYEGNWPKAKFQKGCINFSKAQDIDMERAKAFFEDCEQLR